MVQMYKDVKQGEPSTNSNIHYRPYLGRQVDNERMKEEVLCHISNIDVDTKL